MHQIFSSLPSATPRNKLTIFASIPFKLIYANDLPIIVILYLIQQVWMDGNKLL